LRKQHKEFLKLILPAYDPAISLPQVKVLHQEKRAIDRRNRQQERIGFFNHFQCSFSVLFGKVHQAFNSNHAAAAKVCRWSVALEAHVFPFYAFGGRPAIYPIMQPIQ